MKEIFFLLFFIMIYVTNVSHLYSQNSMLYFLDNVPARNKLNPAFIPDSKWHVDMFLLPDLHTEVANNAFSVKDIIFHKDGRVVTALHTPQDIERFYQRVRNVNSFNTNLDLNLLSFGVSGNKDDYYTFDASIRVSGKAFLPRDLFTLALYGTPEETGDNIFNMTKTGVEASVYSEIGFGYSRRLNEVWTIGGKFKYLMGYASIHSINKRMNLNINQEAWTMDSDAEIFGSVPLDYQTKENKNIDFSSFSLWDTGEYMKLLRSPAGSGMAVDLGVTWQPSDPLIISAALTDIGFIRWKKNLVHGLMRGTYEYAGIEYSKGDSINWEKIGNELEKAFQFGSSSGNPFSQRLTANMLIGAEYAIQNNHISFGGLSRTMMFSSHISQEIMLATNFRPTDWFNAHLTYSFLNGGGNTIGLGTKFRYGPFQTYIMTDYFPFCQAKLITGDNGQTINVPYNSRRINIQIGTVLTFGKK
jgi:hypothetical protein